MLSRRRVLVGAVGALTLPLAGTSRAKAPQPSSTLNFEMPAGACDCHTHVFGDPTRFPLSASRAFTPMPALPDEMARLHRAIKVERVVIVTSSAYATDNSVTLYAIRERGPIARGVVAVDNRTSEVDLEAMVGAGVRGARLYFGSSGIEPDRARERFNWVSNLAQQRGWHVQIFSNPILLAAMHDLLAESPVPVVLDHFAGARGEGGIDQPGFQQLLSLVRAGRVYIKISAPYRFSSRPPDYDDMVPLVKAFIEANPERMLWASDWPHANGDLSGRKSTDVFPFFDIDDAHLLNLFSRWVPDAATRKQILVDNPARLYQF